MRAGGKPPRLPDANGNYFCTSCKTWLPPNDFSAQYGKFSGLKSWCKDCIRINRKKARAEEAEWRIKEEAIDEAILKLIKSDRQLRKDILARNNRVLAPMIEEIKAEKVANYYLRRSRAERGRATFSKAS